MTLYLQKNIIFLKKGKVFFLGMAWVVVLGRFFVNFHHENVRNKFLFADKLILNYFEGMM